MWLADHGTSGPEVLAVGDTIQQKFGKICNYNIEGYFEKYLHGWL